MTTDQLAAYKDILAQSLEEFRGQPVTCTLVKRLAARTQALSRIASQLVEPSLEEQVRAAHSPYPMSSGQ